MAFFACLYHSRLASECQTANDLVKTSQTQMNAIIPVVAGLLICSYACNLSADTPQIRVSIQVGGGPDRANADDARMLSALSHEFRKLDGVSVTDTQPALTIHCIVEQNKATETLNGRKVLFGYSCSVAVTDADGRLIYHGIEGGSAIDRIAHAIAVAVDGRMIEQMRRAAQPSSSP
jgi:hypothetical protein